MREDYYVEIISSSRELTAREKIKVKDTSNAIGLDEATQEAPVVIDYDYDVVLRVHNEKSRDKKDYEKYVVMDKSGDKFVTGSSSFKDALDDITSDLAGCDDEPWSIEVSRKPSKNYAGKSFLTCSLV